MERCMMPETRMTVTIYNYYGPKEIASPLIKHLLSPSRVFQTRCALKPKFLRFGASAGLERRGVQVMIHGQPTGEDKHVENQQPKREEHVVSFVK